MYLHFNKWRACKISLNFTAVRARIACSMKPRDGARARELTSPTIFPYKLYSSYTAVRTHTHCTKFSNGLPTNRYSCNRYFFLEVFAFSPGLLCFLQRLPGKSKEVWTKFRTKIRTKIHLLRFGADSDLPMQTLWIIHHFFKTFVINIFNNLVQGSTAP